MNLGLGVAWPKTLARSGHPSVIGATRVRFGSQSVDAEADKTEQRPQSILLRWWRRPSSRFCFVLTQPTLSCWAMAAIPPCLRAAEPACRPPRALNSRQAHAKRPLGAFACGVPENIDPADHGHIRRTSNPIHGCCTNHDHIVPHLNTQKPSCPVLLCHRLVPVAASSRYQAERSRIDTLVSRE